MATFQIVLRQIRLSIVRLCAASLRACYVARMRTCLQNASFENDWAISRESPGHSGAALFGAQATTNIAAPNTRLSIIRLCAASLKSSIILKIALCGYYLIT
jgi:hypothetical protein